MELYLVIQKWKESVVCAFGIVSCFTTEFSIALRLVSVLEGSTIEKIRKKLIVLYRAVKCSMSAQHNMLLSVTCNDGTIPFSSVLVIVQVT